MYVQTVSPARTSGSSRPLGCLRSMSQHLRSTPQRCFSPSRHCNMVPVTRRSQTSAGEAGGRNAQQSLTPNQGLATENSTGPAQGTTRDRPGGKGLRRDRNGFSARGCWNSSVEIFVFSRIYFLPFFRSCCSPFSFFFAIVFCVQ
jgi:hypothetical protein